MTKQLRIVALAALTAASGAVTTVEAQVRYDFFAPLTGTAGASNGTWTGYVTFNWLTSGGSGSGAAASVVTTEVPSGVATPSQGWDAVLWSVVGLNSFTVTNGVVTSFQFGAESAPDQNRVCMNSGAGFIAGSNFICPQYYNRIGVQSNARGENSEGSAGVSFVEAQTTVPEPSTIVLLASGLGALGFVRRRKARG